jgi:hypothetical protein
MGIEFQFQVFRRRSEKGEATIDETRARKKERAYKVLVAAVLQ